MRLIDADAISKIMYHKAFEENSDLQRWDSGCWIRYKMFEQALAEAPTIDAEPVKRGRWVKDEVDKYKCSECGVGNNYAFSWSINKGEELQDLYCPHCGAKMEVQA